MTILYHSTDAANAILAGGFLDGAGSIVVTGEGGFLSEQPLMDAQEGAKATSSSGSSSATTSTSTSTRCPTSGRRANGSCRPR